LGDEPAAETIARAVAEARERGPIGRTVQLARLIQEAVGKEEWRLRPERGKWETHPAARTVQVLRLLVNPALAHLGELLRVGPWLLRPGGVLAVISFHSGEDRRVKGAFRDGLRGGLYEAVSDEAVRAGPEERSANPRSRSAKLRWARKKAEGRG